MTSKHPPRGTGERVRRLHPMKIYSLSLLAAIGLLPACTMSPPESSPRPSAVTTSPQHPRAATAIAASKSLKRDIKIKDQGWTEAGEPKTHWMLNAAGKLTP